MKLRLLSIIIIASLVSCKMKSTTPFETVDQIDLEKYAGKWYDIAHFPSTFLNGCKNITAEYTLRDKKYMEVFNRCEKIRNGHIKSIKGKAFPVKGSDNSKLKIQFIWPFRADYWILEIEGDYQYACVGGPNRNYAWILSRTPNPDKDIVQRMMDNLERKGFDVSRFRWTVHDEAESGEKK